MKIWTARKQDKAFDAYLKSQGDFFMKTKYQIEPSPDFREKTLTRITAAYEHKVLVTKIWVIISMYLPFCLREIWNFTRNDFFSVGSWPLGGYLTSIYSFAIANATGVYLLGIGLVSTFIYLKGFRIFTPTFRFIGHVFARSEKIA